YRKPALDLKLRVNSCLCFFQHLAGEIGGYDIDAISRDRRTHSFEQHRERIWFLASRCRGTPNSNSFLPRSCRYKRRHDRVAEMVERQLVAEEKSLVGGHRLDDLRREWNRRLGFQPFNQFIERGHAVAAGNRQKAALGEILLLGRQHQSRPLTQKLSQKIEVFRRHMRSPPNRRVNFPAISVSGRTAEQRPALVTWPGIPHTTLVSSSCAITWPPAATIFLAPARPSDPMPVSTKASALLPHTSEADSKSGSTAGLQKFTIGPSSSAITGVPSRRVIRMCLPPGARYTTP